MLKLGKFLGVAICLALSSVSNAATYIEYWIGGVGSGFFHKDPAPGEYPDYISYHNEYDSIFMDLRAYVMLNNPVYGTGYIGISSFDYGYASATGSHLHITVSRAAAHSVDLFGADICFDHDLGGQLPTSSSGFVSGCGSFSISQSTYYTWNNASGVPLYFSARIIDGPEYSGYAEAQLVPNVPEPAIWTMMVLGFGIVGTALRGRYHPQMRLPANRARYEVS